MNQILFSKKNNDKLKIQFIISIIIIIIFLIIFFTKLYKSYQNELVSQKLISSYSISTLYSDSNTNILETFNNSENNDETPFVIGIIKINKISLNYPIISSTNNDLLDISVCRFAGPMPNEVGNLCIAGHNYVDYKLFSRLNEIENKDKIEIYDLSGNCIQYEVYDIYESKANDLSCTFQDTHGEKIVTLITCNNVNGKRLIVHAKEIP